MNLKNYKSLQGTGNQFIAILRRVCLLMALVVLYNSQLQAQVSQTIYFMDKLPQSSLLNPAYQHSHKFHISLPLISSFNMDARTNFASYNDMIFQHPQYDSLITFLHPDADISKFTSKLKDNNFFSPDLHINLLSFGFRLKDMYMSFGVAERASFRVSLPKDLILLGLQGNAQFAGKTADFSGLSAGMSYFREYSAGISKEIDKRLNVGARAKLLFGKANMSFSDSDISLYTDPDSYSMRLRSSFTMNLSMPLTIIRDENGDIDDFRMHFDDDGYDPLDFVFNSSNAGFAIDLGATYRIIDPVTLYASITDLGFINWKQDVYNLTMDGDFEFDGIDLSPELDYTDNSNPGDNLLDSLKGLFSISETSQIYRQALPTRIFLGGTYQVHHLLDIGLLSRSSIYRNNLQQAVTLSANYNLRRWLSASASYSVMNNSYNNIGMGLVLRGGGFQFYMLTDNINTSMAPARTRNINLWFGLNLVFGHKTPAEPESTESY